LASLSLDRSVKIWDVEAETAKFSLNHSDAITTFSWNGLGTLLVTTSADKKIRIWDPRQEKEASCTAGHGSARASRAVWLGRHDYIAATGYSKYNERQLGLWDLRNLEGDTPMTALGSESGVTFPYWDDATNMIYVAGRGYVVHPALCHLFARGYMFANLCLLLQSV